MKIDAINEHVIVEIVDVVVEKSQGGIILPENVANPPQKIGRVLSVGPKCTQGIEIGNIIMFAKHGGQDIMDIATNKIFKVLKEGEIYGILRETEVQ